jgi:predicted RNA binding protein YcfA (HicA-like mRNA interferase family)
MIRPVKTKEWIKFLESNGCYYVRTAASHDIYQCPQCKRKIVFRGQKKEIPPEHLKTNLKTMTKTLEELYKWIDKNC